MRKLFVLFMMAMAAVIVAAGCAKKDTTAENGQEMTEYQKTEAAAETESAAEEEKAEELQTKSYKDYEEFGKDAQWFYDNYGEPDEEADDGRELILAYYDKNAEYGLSETWELDKDGEIKDDTDPVTCCFRIDLKDGDDIVETIIHPDYEPEEETEEVQVLTPNPNGPY